jgi:CDP-4-dehydro-6-deoxyglucose reductase
MRRGDAVTVSGPHGRFVLDENSRHPLIFMACETGFAPIKSLIEHAISLELNCPMHLYWVTARPGRHYMSNYCRAWQDSVDNFRYTFLDLGVSETSAGPQTAGRKDIISASLQMAAMRALEDYPDIAACDVYVNGPPDVTRDAGQLMLSHGLPREQLFIDEMQRY